MNNIDFVVLWVDDSDPNWLKEKAHFSPKTSEKIKTDVDTAARYRDWNNMKYWFRSIDRFAPWVRKIHFVTYGHLPDFLDTSNEKINIVNIPDLSEQFVFFNDDMFLTKPVKPTDYFEKGLPKLEGLEGTVTSIGDGGSYCHMLLNDLDVINRHFDKRTQIKKNLGKWYNIKYGAEIIRNIVLMPWGYFVGFKNAHLPMPFLKSTLDEVWNLEYDVLNETRHHRFRTFNDVNQYVFRYWQLVTGKFIPQHSMGKYYDIGSDTINEIVSDITNQKYPMICINDSDEIEDFEKYKAMINNAFETVFSKKSSFEK